MRVTARRLDGGKPLREAMTDTGHNRISLAAKTKEVDQDGFGVSQQLIAFLATDREWGRETASVLSATLIAQALGRPEDTLFVMPEKTMP